MKQTSVKLPSGEYILAETKHGVWYDKPKGNWQLLGADPTALTEEEAGKIVESWPSVSGEAIRVYQRYPDEIPKCRTATASIDSLAQSLGISKPYVILKNVEK